jgi:PAS domain S-box-containing protein
MSLRKQTMMIIGLTTCGLIVVLYVFSQTILLSGFAALESQDVGRNIQRALDALAEDEAALARSAGDYAVWDDTYAFIQGEYPDYPKMNLTRSTFAELRLNALVLVQSSGQIRFAQGFDLRQHAEAAVPAGLLEHLAAGSPLLRHADPTSQLTGIILLPEGPLLVAARPIVTGDYQGPIRGTLIMGRYLDAAEIGRLAELTQLSLTVARFDDGQLPADLQSARAGLSAGSLTWVQPLNQERVAGYALLKDVEGQPALILKAELPRQVYQQGQTIIDYFVLSLVAAGLVFGVICVLLLDKRVLVRLTRLSATVNQVAASGDVSVRAAVTGSDELSRLAAAVNGMLGAIQQAQAALRTSQEELEKRVEERTARLTRANLLMRQQIAERKQAQAEIKRHLEIEQTLARASARFVRVEDFDGAVRDALREIGQLSGSSRAYLFLFYEDATRMDNSHEWCAEGVPSQLQDCRQMPTSRFPWWMKRIVSGGFIYIEDVSKLPAEAQAEQASLQQHHTCSVLALPVQADAELLGYLGFDHVFTPGTWSGEDVYVLQIVALTIGKVLQHKRVREALESQRAFLKQVIDLNPNLIFAKDRAGRFTLANQATADLYGVTVEALIGRCDADFLPGAAGWEALHRSDLEVLDTLRELVVPEESVVDAAGSQRRFRTVKKPIVGPDGETWQVLGVSTEITGRRE